MQDIIILKDASFSERVKRYTDALKDKDNMFAFGIPGRSTWVRNKLVEIEKGLSGKWCCHNGYAFEVPW
jgi:hypothetical protein